MPIRPSARAAIIAFVLIYQVAVPGLQEIFHPSPTPLVAARLFAEWAGTLLVLAPLLMYGSRLGWLHPLVFPLLWSLALSAFKNPEGLLAPIAMFSGPREDVLVHSALTGLSEEAIAFAHLKGSLLEIGATAAYYIAFFLGPRLRVPSIRIGEPRHVAKKMFIVVALAFVGMLLFIGVRGGLVAHILSWGRGRSVTLEGTGPALVFVQIGTVAALLWYAFVPSAVRNPAFWVSAAFVTISDFFMSGSRSSIAFVVALFLMIWMFRHRKVPAVRAVVSGVAFFMILGALGYIRQSALRGDHVDWQTVVEADASSLISMSRKTIGSRPEGYVAVVALAPEVGYLWGKSYLGALFFWIPSAVWEGKPSGAGAYAGELLFHKRGGVPPGPVGEAYWNFHVPGMLVVFFLFGLFHLWLARVIARYPAEPAIWVFYVVALRYFNPHAVEMVKGFQMVVPGLVLLVWIGVLWGRRRPRGHLPVSRYALPSASA